MNYPDWVTTVRLKAKSPVTITVTGPLLYPDRMTKAQIDFSLEEDCRELVPVEWWEQHKSEWLDRNQNLRYKDFFTEL